MPRRGSFALRFRSPWNSGGAAKASENPRWNADLLFCTNVPLSSWPNTLLNALANKENERSFYE
jgi:hypothetical protein